MPVPKRIMVTTRLVILASWVYPQDRAPQEQGMAPEDSVNATYIYKASEFKQRVLERHRSVKQKDHDKAENR